MLRKLCESQKLPQSSLQSPAMPSGEIFANLLKRLLADSEEDVQLAALSTRSAPVKSCHESYALTANILESVSQVRKRLCYGDERVVNRLKLALDIFHALAADAVRCVSFTISDGVSGTDSGPPIKSKAPDWVLLNSALLQLWPVVANNYAIDYGSLGLAALLQDIPEASAVFLGECVLDYTLQQGGVTHVDTVWTSTLEFLYWRWLQAMQNASQSSLPGCVLTDLIKLKIRRDWIVLQYEMVLASAAKPDRSIDSLLHASDLLKDIILTRTYVVCIPYLSEKMDTVKTSTVSCIGKMSPARELLLELNQTTFAAVYDDSEMELLKDRLDRAAYIYDTCHDLSSMLGSLKKYYAAECRDGLEMDPEPLLFLRYLTLLRDSRCERGLQDRFLGALDRVYSLMWRDLHSNIKENLLDDAEKEVEALSMWAVPLLRDLFGDKKAEIQNLIDYDINNFNGKKFMRIFRRISFFALVATRYIGVSPVSSLCLLCIELLGCLASFPLSDRLPHGSIQYLVEISIGLCLHFWKTDRDKGNNGAVKGIRRGLICAFADLIKTAIFDPPRPNAFIMGKYFSSLSKWIFCSSCTDEMHTYNIFNFLIESFSMFATLKKSLPKTDLGSISCAIEINQYACILITMELIYALLCKQDSDDQDIDIGEIVYAFCACIMEMSTNQFFTMADGALQVDILHRLLCVVYHSEACVDLIGARILTAASSTEDPDFIKCAALMDLQDHVTDSPLHAVCEAIAQLCSSLYKFPDLGQNSIPLETLAISNNSSRISSLDLVLPSHLIPGVFIFLKFWDDCYVTLPRATWGLCFTQMYKSMCLRCPPISQRATSFHAYLFEPLKDAMGERGELGGLFESDQDLLDRAKDTCIYVIALDRIKQNNLNQDNATADEILLDWVRSDFYEKYQSCGCVVSIKSDKSHTEANAFSRARKSGDVTISAVENVDYYFNFVCDAEAKNCPALTLALQCLCHSYELEGQYDSLVRIANGLYELASAALDEMTSYCFPINAVADDYIPVHIFDGSDHPNCTLENILSGIFAAVPFGNFPSILSLLCDPVTASKDVMKGVNELFDGQISTLDYQHIEEAVLWGSRPTPCPGFSYSASVIFLCRYHKSVMHLFDKVYSLFFTMYFRKHIVSQNLVLSSEQITELVKFVVSPGTGCAVVPADTADEDLVGGIGSEDFSSSAKTALSKATISMTEMKVILESHLAVILKNHEEQKIECFKRAMKHALQGLL